MAKVIPVGNTQLGLDKLPNLCKICFTSRLEARSTHEWIYNQLVQAPVNNLESMVFLVVADSVGPSLAPRHLKWIANLVDKVDNLKRNNILPKLKKVEVRIVEMVENALSAREKLRKGAQFERKSSPEGWDVSAREFLLPLEKSGVKADAYWGTSQKSVWYTSIIL